MVRLGSPADFPHSLRNKIRRRKKQNDFPKYHPYRAMHDKLTLSSGPPNRERGSSGVDWYWLGFQRRGSPEHPPPHLFMQSLCIVRGMRRFLQKSFPHRHARTSSFTQPASGGTFNGEKPLEYSEQLAARFSQADPPPYICEEVSVGIEQGNCGNPRLMSHFTQVVVDLSSKMGVGEQTGQAPTRYFGCALLAPIFKGHGRARLAAKRVINMFGCLSA